jgi:hypothetical protein
MRRSCWKWSALGFALASLVGAPQALAQTEQPPPEQPPPEQPSPPDLVLSGRDVRLNRAGYAHVRIACRQTSTPGEVCIGTLTLRLGEALTVRVGSKDRHLAKGFKLGVASFQLSVGSVATLTFHLTPVLQRAVRQAGDVSVQQIGAYVSKSGAPAPMTKRSFTLYFPTRPPI